MHRNATGNERAALIAALTAVALWSTVATAFKLALVTLAPLQLLLLGTLVSTVFFWSAAVATGRWSLSMSQLLQSACFGLANPLAYYVVLFEAYDRLPAQIAQPLNYTWAIMMALLAVPLLGQSLSRRTLAGIVLSYLGVVVLLAQGPLGDDRPPSWSGVALALLSTVLWAGYWLMKTRSTVPPLLLMAWSFVFAMPLVLMACWLGPGLPELTLRHAAYGLWVGLVEMGVTFLLWQRALRLTAHAARVGQLIFLSPFLSFVLIGTVLGETIRASSVVGLIVIVAGLLLARTES